MREVYADYPNVFNALMRFENGCTGFLQANWVAGTRRHIFEMHGKGITAYIDPDDTARVYADGKDEPTVLDVNQAAGNDGALPRVWVLWRKPPLHRLHQDRPPARHQLRRRHQDHGTRGRHLPLGALIGRA